jgi:demethylmenaquinone methyltransferase/2-methoxy-6-polyprenyl-1,4-benzoquinol methylase
LESAEQRPSLIEYYRRRAGEYEAFYAKPERQADLLLLKKKLAELLKNARLLEIACGTGYWTTVIANAAASVTATDLAQEPMNIARAKPYPKNNVTFVEADAYALPQSLGRFDAAFAGFWWSHVPRERIAQFVASLHARLEPGATVLLLDNLYVEGNSTPISEIDRAGNTYQLRTLADGSVFRVMKNFPTKDELRALLPAPVHYRALQYHWLAQYQV